MNTVFYISAAVAVLATADGRSRGRNAVHALLYLIVSLLAVAVIFFTLGAPFVAALEVIIYAGAIMVLFVFVIMMLNLGAGAGDAGAALAAAPRAWIGPALLALVLLAELVYVLARRARRRPVPAPRWSAASRSAVAAVRPVPAGRGAGLAAAAGGRWSAPTTSARREPDTPRDEEERGLMATVPLEHGLILAARPVRAGAGRACWCGATSSSCCCPSRSCSTPPGWPSSSPGSRWAQPDGQVMFLFILAMAAAEVAVGLALVLQLYHRFKTLDVDAASEMRG